MPPASPAEALRLSGDALRALRARATCGFGAFGLVAESGAVAGSPRVTAAAAADGAVRRARGCVALPPTMMRPPWGPTFNSHVRGARRGTCSISSSGTFTTRQSSAFALASMISTWRFERHRPRRLEVKLDHREQVLIVVAVAVAIEVGGVLVSASSASWAATLSSGPANVPAVRQRHNLRAARMFTLTRLDVATAGSRCVSATCGSP